MDRIQYRASCYKSGSGTVTHTEKILDDWILPSVEFVDEQVQSVRAELELEFSSVKRFINDLEIACRAQRVQMDRPNLPPHVRLEILLIVRVVINGARTRIPVLWQRAWGEAKVNTIKVGNDLVPEIEAIISAEVLHETIDCALVLSPWTASQFIHECIGHTSEADNWLEYIEPIGYGVGYRWCEYPLQVFDDPTLPGHRGSYEFDFDGNSARKTQLIRDGMWSDLIANQSCRESLHLKYGGNGRRVFGSGRVLPRMSVTYAAPGNQGIEEIVGSVNSGIYCFGVWGGGSQGSNFILRPTYGLWIKDGQLTERAVRRFDIVGNKFDVIRNVVAASSDFRIYDPVFGCDKHGEDNLPITCGAPDLLLNCATVRPF